MFKVYCLGFWPKKKKDFFDGEFKKRQSAINFCRKRSSFTQGLVIVHPCGKEEKFN